MGLCDHDCPITKKIPLHQLGRITTEDTWNILILGRRVGDFLTLRALVRVVAVLTRVS